MERKMRRCRRRAITRSQTQRGLTVLLVGSLALLATLLLTTTLLTATTTAVAAPRKPGVKLAPPSAPPARHAEDRVTARACDNTTRNQTAASPSWTSLDDVTSLATVPRHDVSEDLPATSPALRPVATVDIRPGGPQAHPTAADPSASGPREAAAQGTVDAHDEGVPPRVDLRHATAAELATLPGIGPTRADAIIRYRSRRPLRRLRDLRRIRGIGPKLVRSLRDRVKLEDHPGDTHDRQR